MNAFTRQVLDTMIREEGTADTVREWRETEADPETRAVRFAFQLERDFEASYDVSSRKNPDLADLLLFRAVEYVNWETVARGLLERFAPRPTWTLPAATPSAN